MARKLVPRQVRRKVRLRASKRCEYCQHPDAFSCAPFVCEHVVPRSRGAGSTLDDLAWSCAGCNGHKSNKTRHADPATGKSTRLFNPRRQRWLRHFMWSEDHLLIFGRTAAGRATVEALHLNRIELINLRHALVLLGMHPHDDATRHGPMKPR